MLELPQRRTVYDRNQMDFDEMLPGQIFIAPFLVHNFGARWEDIYCIKTAEPCYSYSFGNWTGNCIQLTTGKGMVMIGYQTLETVNLKGKLLNSNTRNIRPFSDLGPGSICQWNEGEDNLLFIKTCNSVTERGANQRDGNCIDLSQGEGWIGNRTDEVHVIDVALIEV